MDYRRVATVTGWLWIVPADTAGLPHAEVVSYTNP